MPRRYFIKTFGCQMNEYDSDKMADVLSAADGLDAHRRRRPTPTSSCSTPARCAKKRRRRCSPISAACAHLKAANPELIIGVGGCVASQEGAAIVRACAVRRPRVRPANVAPPAGDDRAPAKHRPAAGRHQVPGDREVRLTCRRRASRARSAFVSIMEGCSKYCSYCVVPYTRGEEVSRPFDDVLTEIAGLADQGVAKSRCSARTSTPTVAPWPTARPKSPISRTLHRIRRARFRASSAFATPRRIRRNSRSA